MNFPINAWAFLMRFTASSEVDFSFIKASPPLSTDSKELIRVEAYVDKKRKPERRLGQSIC